MMDLQNLLNTAKDIVILERDAHRNNYRFAIPFSGDLARECYEKTLAMDNDLPEFQGHWEFNKQKRQITGSSNFLQTRLSRVLRPMGLELPDTLDLIALDKKRKLPLGFYIDFGIVVYSDENPNQETARGLIEKAKQEVGKLPLLYSPGDLDYVVSDGHAKIILVDEPRRVVSGEKAEEILQRFFIGGLGSGARSACWHSDGYLFADWDNFVNSYSDGLVGWVCAEGTRENLTEGYNLLLGRELMPELKL